MNNWERIGSGIVIALVVAFAVAILYGKYLDDVKDGKCSDACGIAKYLVIGGKCNCMTEDGWRAQEDK